MRVAVTGGAGFIGGRLVRKLKDRGHEVLVVDVKPGDGDMSTNHRADITDLAAVKEVLKDIDVVYHLAGPVLEQFRKNPYASHHLQEVGTLNVLEVARLNRIPKVVLASSFYVYDGIDEKMIVNEETPLDITRMELFGASKFMAEKLVKSFAAKYGLQFVILRFGSAYGWGDCSNVVKSFIEMGIKGGPIEIWGKGTRRNQYTYVDDVAEGCLMALEEVNETYNLVSPEETTTGELAWMLKEAFGYDLVFNEVQPEGPSMATMSSKKAMMKLGWKPIPVHEGVGRIKLQLAGENKTK